MKDATAVMDQYQEHVKNLEADGGNSEEIDGDQLLASLASPTVMTYYAVC